MTFTDFSGKLYPVSERNTMNLFKKNQMTLKEIGHFMDAKRKREAKTRENLKRIGEAAARKVKREKEMFEAAEAVGSTNGDEILDFGCEC